MKILFMGTPDFAKESLKSIYEAKHEILGVITNPDRPKGRGMKMIPSPVKEYAIEKGLKIYQPEKIKNNEEILSEIKRLNPEVICVVAYGKILPKEIVEIPKKGCINVHASLLPKYRGAAPIQWAVINGDKTTGITTMYINEGMDEGDMILTEEVEIGSNETTGELWERLSNLGGKLLVKTLEQIEKGTAPRIKQKGESSLAPMLDKKMAKINWENKSALEIKNLIRGLNPIMGAYSYLEGKKIKIWRADVLDISETAELEQLPNYQKQSNGTIIKVDSKQGVYVKTKQGILKILEVQAENSKKMNIKDYLNGNTIEILSKFE